MEIFVKNRKATFDYDFSSGQWEMGLVLKSRDVKAIRNHTLTISEGYGVIHDREVWLKNVNVAGLTKQIKLLAHRREINKIIGTFEKKSYVLIPIEVYDKNGKIKVQMGMGKQKSKHDKREKIKQRDLQREARYFSDIL